MAPSMLSSPGTVVGVELEEGVPRRTGVPEGLGVGEPAAVGEDVPVGVCMELDVQEGEAV